MMCHSLGDTDWLAVNYSRLQAIYSDNAARWLENEEEYDKVLA